MEMHKGFTLIELLVVIAIIAVLMATPRSTNGSTRPRSAPSSNTWTASPSLSLALPACPRPAPKAMKTSCGWPSTTTEAQSNSDRAMARTSKWRSPRGVSTDSRSPTACPKIARPMGE